jgi:hypothetical protein
MEAEDFKELNLTLAALREELEKHRPLTQHLQLEMLTEADLKEVLDKTCK